MSDEPPSPVAWARQQAGWLRPRAQERDLENFAYPVEARPIASKALAFLEGQAPRSRFLHNAEEVFAAPGRPEVALVAVAVILEAWADFVDEGFAAATPFEARARREAATDLMEQVQVLLDDPKVHVAAPVVLAGAALEEFLRSMLATTPAAVVVGRPGIQAYAEALRKVEVLSAQDVKDITAWAGQRNAAAHGQFEQLSLDRARLMVDGVNLFMRQHTPASPT